LIRGTETQQEIDVRLANAEKEIMESQEKGLFDAIIINDNFESASKAFFRLIRDWFVILS
jgi:guanylate kinase